MAAVPGTAASAAAAAAAADGSSALDMWGHVAGWGANVVGFFASANPTMILIRICQTILCLMFLTFLMLLIAIAIYILRHVQPRLPVISHTVDLDTWTSGRIEELTNAINLMARRSTHPAWWFASSMDMVQIAESFDPVPSSRSGPRKPSTSDVAAMQAQLGNVAKNIRAACATLARRDLETDLLTYFKFSAALNSMSSLSQYDLKWNCDALSTDGDLDGALVRDFQRNVMRPLASLQDGVTTLSDLLTRLPGLSSQPGFPDDCFRLIGFVHRTRMILGYRSNVTRMYMTRRGNLPFAMWTVYYWPFVRDIYEHRIPEAWVKIPFRYVDYLKSILTWWDGVGAWAGNIPCTMAHSDPQERLRKCKSIMEKFSGFAEKVPLLAIAKKDKKDEQPEKTDANANVKEGLSEVIEGISIGRALSSIVSLVRNISFIGVAMKRFAGAFNKDPFGAVIQIIGYILGMILGLILTLLITLLTVLGIIFVVAHVISTFMTFTLALLFTIFQILISVLIAIPYLVLWLIDLCTNGLITSLLRCENLPDDWASMPSGVDGNGYNKQPDGLICKMPCFSRYTPYGGLCYRKDGHMPDLCPQQQIAQIFVGRDDVSGSPWSLDKYKPAPQFLRKSMGGKISSLVDVYRDKVSWYQKCFDKLGGYEYATDYVCSDVARFGKIRNLSQNVAEKLAVLCQECNCKYRRASVKRDKQNTRAIMTDHKEERATNVCVRLAKLAAGESGMDRGANWSLSGPGVEMLQTSAKIGIGVVVVLCMMYSLFTASDTMVEQYTAPPSQPT